MTKHVRLSILLALLGLLLLYVWVTDRPSPAYPQGAFWTNVQFTAVIVGVALIIALFVRWATSLTRRSGKQ
jgi:cell division protein FtsW (lipid II flippase)